MAKNVHGVQTSRDVKVRYFFGFGPYPWILDTGCDYAAVGSVAVVRAVS
jgi:hypothetical protein